MTFKSVDYAYPTSPSASKFGFGKTGCYCVELSKDQQPPKAIAGYATRQEALAHAKRLPESWSSAFLHFHAKESR